VHTRGTASRVTRSDALALVKLPASARVDADLVVFLDAYRERERLASRSEALERTIRALRERALEVAHAAMLSVAR